MKITNKTKWRTDDLRFVVGQCLRERGASSKGLSVHVATRRRLRVTAEPAWWFKDTAGQRAGERRMRQGTYIVLRLPAPDTIAPSDLTDRVVEIVRMIDWAAAAIIGAVPKRGLDPHRPIAWLADWYAVNCSDKGRAAGCPQQPLRQKPVEDRAVKREKRIEHMRALVRRAESRAKRATNHAAKLRRSLAALERAHERVVVTGGKGVDK